MTFYFQQDWDDEGHDDAEIEGLVDLSGEGWLAHPDFAAFAEKHEKSFPHVPPGDDRDRIIANEWHRELRDRNSKLRQQHSYRKVCREKFLALCPRPAATVLSDGFEASPEIEKLSTLSDKRCIAVLSGPPGTGKTTAAAAWAWSLTGGKESSRLPAWKTAAEFGRSSRYDDERGILLRQGELVVDDLGTEYSDAKGSLRTDVDELVDAFYSRQQRLVITTNLDAKTFEERYGARVWDRLHEAGMWIPMVGKSRRRGGP